MFDVKKSIFSCSRFLHINNLNDFHFKLWIIVIILKVTNYSLTLVRNFSVNFYTVHYSPLTGLDGSVTSLSTLFLSPDFSSSAWGDIPGNSWGWPSAKKAITLLVHPQTEHGTQDHSLRGRQGLGFFLVHPQLGEHPRQSHAHTMQIPRRQAPHENQHLLLIQCEKPRTKAYPIMGIHVVQSLALLQWIEFGKSPL